MRRALESLQQDLIAQSAVSPARDERNWCFGSSGSMKHALRASLQKTGAWRLLFYWVRAKAPVGLHNIQTCTLALLRGGLAEENTLDQLLSLCIFRVLADRDSDPFHCLTA